MNKKLAIKGHPTRGKEVIKLLEMLGGINDAGHIGTNTWKDKYYFLDNGYIRAYDWCDGIKFTLEEFLDKYPFKVGDFVCIPEYESEVRICKIKWCEFGYVEYLVYRNDDEEWYTANELMEYNDKPSPGEITQLEKTIEKNNTTNHMPNVLAELLEHIKNTSKEELEREFNELEAWSHVGPTVEEFMDFCNKVYKKPEYPKTYEECAEIMGVEIWNTLWGEDATEYEVQTEKLINALIRLKVCRDAYWKIAGDELGLDKPWEFENPSKNWVFTIEYAGGNIYKNAGMNILYNHKLVFPTEDIRDAFYENFKDLIDKCKELL